jgi:hypothetical protein
MTEAEKQVLLDLVQIIQTLTVKVDALEGVLVRRGVIQDLDRPALTGEYVQAALNDLAPVRTAISYLRTN